MSAKRVIIIDDSPYIIGLLERFFIDQMQFNVVATALDGTGVLELYRKFRPDLLTLDLSMPGKNGTLVLREVLREFPDANVLIISAVRGEPLLECMNAGARGYLEKPLRLSESDYIADFVESVNEAISGPPAR
jgi:two-component system chemotaxis response regulator CheY